MDANTINIIILILTAIGVVLGLFSAIRSLLDTVPSVSIVQKGKNTKQLFLRIEEKNNKRVNYKIKYSFDKEKDISIISGTIEPLQSIEKKINISFPNSASIIKFKYLFKISNRPETWNRKKIVKSKSSFFENVKIEYNLDLTIPFVKPIVIDANLIKSFKKAKIDEAVENTKKGSKREHRKQLNKWAKDLNNNTIIDYLMFTNVLSSSGFIKVNSEEDIKELSFLVDTRDLIVLTEDEILSKIESYEEKLKAPVFRRDPNSYSADQARIERFFNSTSYKNTLLNDKLKNSQKFVEDIEKKTRYFQKINSNQYIHYEENDENLIIYIECIKKKEEVVFNRGDKENYYYLFPTDGCAKVNISVLSGTYNYQYDYRQNVL